LGRCRVVRLISLTGFCALALSLTACGTLSGAFRADSALSAGPPVAAQPAADNAVSTEPSPPTVTAAAPTATADAPETPVPMAPAKARPEEGMAQARDSANDLEPDEYDPWEGFNEKTFEFNRRLDKYVLKPVAKGYNFVVPDELQIMISNGFDNISFVPRMMNSLFQGKFGGAGRELGRFLINSTVGVGGLFDPAKDVFGLVKSREDFGQTLGVYGVTPGPYVIVPFLEPLTVRDGIGKAVDGLMDPLSWFLPFFWERFGMKVGDIVNERSLNLDLFQGFEESVIDMYSAVRHAYLQRRLRLIRE
jgi:phospholipid-binding lipoprotein MlaA